MSLSVSALELLEKREYLGRAFILGKSSDDKYRIIVYILTGRSSVSQTRKCVFERDGLYVKPLNYAEMKSLYEETKDARKSPELLVYPAVLFNDYGLAISNGKQTTTFDEDMRAAKGESIVNILNSANNKWSYEPDEPNFTPRVSGVFTNDGHAGFAIVRKDGEVPSRNIYSYSSVPGKGHFISTYSGVNMDPLPSFSGLPIEVNIDASSPEELAKSVYSALAPSDPEKDFRISVAAIFVDSDNNYRTSVINRF